MSEDFVGAGWAFPVQTGPTGGIALVRREQEIEQAIRLILGTALGERPMRPMFGCAIHDYIFSPVDSTTAGKMAWEVRQSLIRWEPRITVEDIAVTFDTDNPSTIYINIVYSIRGSNDPRNLVFPFYVIPAEG